MQNYPKMQIMLQMLNIFWKIVENNARNDGLCQK